MATAARQIEIFKHEYEDLASSLQAEKRTVNVLKVMNERFDTTKRKVIQLC